MVQQQRTSALEKYALDGIDLRVLRAYQEDAALSYRDLGEMADLPPSTVFDRVKRLRRLGIIKTIVPLLDMESLGFMTTAWLFVKTGTDPDCCQVADAIAKIPDILEVHEIAGAYDLLVKVKAKDNLDYHNISERIIKTPGVRDSSSTISIRTVKEDIRPRI